MTTSRRRGFTNVEVQKNEEIEQFKKKINEIEYSSDKHSSMRRLIKQLKNAANTEIKKFETLTRKNLSYSQRAPDEQADEYKLNIEENKISEMLIAADKIMDDIFGNKGLISLDGEDFNTKKTKIDEALEDFEKEYTDFISRPTNSVDYSKLSKLAIFAIPIILIFAKITLILGFATTALYLHSKVEPPLNKVLRDIVDTEKRIDDEEQSAKEAKDRGETYKSPFFSRLNFADMRATATEKMEQLAEKISNIFSSRPGRN